MATKKKTTAAKKKTVTKKKTATAGEPSKASLIRDYKNSHPTANKTEIAEALSKEHPTHSKHPFKYGDVVSALRDTGATKGRKNKDTPAQPTAIDFKAVDSAKKLHTLLKGNDNASEIIAAALDLVEQCDNNASTAKKLYHKIAE